MMTSTSELPSIPEEWDLTDQQRKNMVEAQKKIKDLDNSRRSAQQKLLDTFMSFSSQNPPSYPILVLIKQNNKITQQLYLMDNNKNNLYASTFEDATSRVKLQLADPKSTLQLEYAKYNPGSKPLRISSDNIKSAPKLASFSLIPNIKYKYWEITTTNAPTSFLSNMRMAMRGGFKKSKKDKKAKKSRKSRKTKRK